MCWKLFGYKNGLREEIKATRDKTEHYDPRTTLVFKGDKVNIPIFKRENNRYDIKRKVRFQDYVIEINKAIKELVNELIKVY